MVDISKCGTILVMSTLSGTFKMTCLFAVSITPFPDFKVIPRSFASLFFSGSFFSHEINTVNMPKIKSNLNSLIIFEI